MNVYLRITLLIIFILALGLIIRHTHTQSQKYTIESVTSCLWEICSIDTMKTSRDMARAELYNPEFDKTIQNEIKKIKKSGANYVAVGTPYDNEFLPYLKRWVKEARKQKLSVWFRGNWSNYEGWFEYPKNLSPEGHIEKTAKFIKDNPDLFADGDIFDACPECENAGHWPQPEKNKEYNQFIQRQKESLAKSFNAINKNVKTNIASIIGGRAKEVLDDKTLSALDNVVSIDHYFKDPQSISDYIDYFSKHNTKLVHSEFGAPIPDMHGVMTDAQQAEFVEDVLERLYTSQSVIGVNYWVLSLGTTALLNSDNSPKPAYFTLQKYFMPGIVSGKIVNTLNEPLEQVEIKTSDGVKAITNKDGIYTIKIPQRKTQLYASIPNYIKVASNIEISKNGQHIKKDITLTPINPGIIYKIKLFFHDISH